MAALQPQRWAFLAARHYTAGAVQARCVMRVAVVPAGQEAECICRWELDADDQVDAAARRLLATRAQETINEVARQMGRRIVPRHVWCGEAQA